VLLESYSEPHPRGRYLAAALGAVAAVLLLDAAAIWRSSAHCRGALPGSNLDHFCNGSGGLFWAWALAIPIGVVAVIIAAVWAVRSRSFLPFAYLAAPVIGALVIAWRPVFL
jgi:hypothetical protein